MSNPENVESFEDQTDLHRWMVVRGNISLSDRHFKDRKQSLLWQWQEGSVLSFNQPKHLAEASAHVHGGMMFWVYSETPLDDTFKVTFLDADDNAQCDFTYKLNFSGWRSSWVRFHEDLGYPGLKPLVRMIVQSPKGSQGKLYFDLIEFHPQIADLRSSSWQWQINAVERQEWATYAWSLLKPTVALPETLSQTDTVALNLINSRLDNWLYGTGKYTHTQAYRIRKQSLNEFIQKAKVEYKKHRIVRHPDGLITGVPLHGGRNPFGQRNLDDPAKPLQADFNEAFGSVLYPLSLDYKINKNLESRDKVMLLFDYFYDQGWAAGSALGTLDHQVLGTMGWAAAVYIMRNELKAAGKLERELAAVDWFYTFKESFPTKSYEITADAMRNKAMGRFLRVMAMDNSPQKVQYLRSVLNYFKAALEIRPGWGDTIKPDFTGYHHRGSYANAYIPRSYNSMSLIAYLLRETPFTIDEESLENLRQALYTHRIISNKYETPLSMGGRINQTKSAIKTIQAYAYMSYLKPGGGIDPVMLSAYKRLWAPNRPDMAQLLYRLIQARFSLLHTFGELEVLFSTGELPGEPEPDPQGFWIKPYAGAAVQRRGNWMAFVRGHSQYVWSYEAHDDENVYGRYLSHGFLQVLSAGDPVNYIDSGYNISHGFDWNRLPAATTIHLPLDELHIPPRDHEWQIENPYHRIWNHNTFLGGVSLDNEVGLWAMDFRDEIFEPLFVAKKSIFFFHDEIVCLGSDIRHPNSEHNTETTLFQSWIPSRNTAIHVGDMIRQKKIDQYPYDMTVINNTGQWLLDPQGNAYIVPNALGLNVRKQHQESKDHSPKGKREIARTQGDFAVAWLDHGRAPEQEEYEYAILMQTTPNEARAYLKAPGYQVLRKDRKAHIVQQRETGLTGYALFNNAIDLPGDLLESVSAPVMIMTQDISRSKKKLALCDPDFRREYVRNEEEIYAEKGNVFDPGRSQVVRLQLRGSWEVRTKNPAVTAISITPNSTVVEIACYDARNYEMELVKR
ncbi:MAG: chondroitinase family polysaccharide lyase [Planctomycetota bacterium]